MTVCKKSDSDGSLETTNDREFVSGWEMTLYSDGEQVGDTQVTNSDGCYVFENLGPDNDYSVVEESRSGWTPMDSSATHDFGTPVDGVDQDFTFINFPHGSITVNKMVDSNGDGTFETTNPETFNWSLDGSGANAMGDTVSGVSTGSHDVSENDVTDYHFVGWFYTDDEGSCENERDLEGTSLPANINVSTNETTDITLCNARDTGKITVNKEVVSTTEDSGMFDLQVDSTTEKTDTQDGDSTGKVTVLTGTHSVSEVAGTETSLSDYTSSISCVDGGREGDEIASTDGNGTSLSDIQVSKDDDVVCTITNTKKGKVIVTKYNDLNGDGKLDSGEGVLGGWTINLGEESKDTSSDGQAVFDGLVPNSYSLSEDLKTGWEQTNISCDQRSFVEGDVRVDAGQIVNCSILNHSITPVLTIAKSNNAAGDRAPGDEVIYTITVTATQSAVLHVAVKDLLPKGFVYVGGSWTATLNGSPLSISEPTYSSPGVWSIGDMDVDDVVVLTYKAKIDSNQQNGLYKDVAWAQGESLASENVLALAEPTGYVDTNFVGTQVNILREESQSPSLAKVRQDVLGASTEALPGTGVNSIWVILAGGMLAIGLSLAAAGYIIRKRYV